MSRLTIVATSAACAAARVAIWVKCAGAGIATGVTGGRPEADTAAAAADDEVGTSVADTPPIRAPDAVMGPARPWASPGGSGATARSSTIAKTSEISPTMARLCTILRTLFGE